LLINKVKKKEKKKGGKKKGEKVGKDLRVEGEDFEQGRGIVGGVAEKLQSAKVE